MMEGLSLRVSDDGGSYKFRYKSITCRKKSDRDNGNSSMASEILHLSLLWCGCIVYYLWYSDLVIICDGAAIQKIRCNLDTPQRSKYHTLHPNQQQLSPGSLLHSKPHHSSIQYRQRDFLYQHHNNRYRINVVTISIALTRSWQKVIRFSGCTASLCDVLRRVA